MRSKIKTIYFLDLFTEALPFLYKMHLIKPSDDVQGKESENFSRS
jgi:hypothetical protein